MNFFSTLAQSFGPQGFPSNYIIIDTETNGIDVFNPQVVPIQLGYVTVHDNQVIRKKSIIADWSKVFQDANVFWYLIEETRNHMAARGQAYHIDRETILEHGIDPTEAFNEYLTAIKRFLDFGSFVVGHNIFGFDCPLIERAAAQIGCHFRFPHEQTIDTALIERARVTGIAKPEHVRSFYRRIKDARVSGSYNLQMCVQRYSLDSQSELEHEAIQDCLIVYQLIEKWREMAGYDEKEISV